MERTFIILYKIEKLHVLTVTDIYREIIPSDAPPSYRGHAVKYSYKITVGTQRVNTAIKLLRVPFRVLSLSGDVIFFAYCFIALFACIEHM